MTESNSEYIKAIFSQSSSLIKADNIKLSGNINPIKISNMYTKKLLSRKYLCGLMQNICWDLSLDMAKLIPIVRVAGKAGGTTMVIRSSARTMIVCQTI